jgi:hypothetical protein
MSIRLHGVTPIQTTIFIVISVRTTNLTQTVLSETTRRESKKHAPSSNARGNYFCLQKVNTGQTVEKFWIVAEKTVGMETYTAESVWMGEHATSTARVFTKRIGSLASHTNNSTLLHFRGFLLR